MLELIEKNDQTLFRQINLVRTLVLFFYVFIEIQFKRAEIFAHDVVGLVNGFNCFTLRPTKFLAKTVTFARRVAWSSG